MTPLTKFIALAAAAGVACGVAAADAVHAVKMAVTRYDTHSSTDGIFGAGVPAGADTRIGDANTLVFAYQRALGPNLSVEFVVGVPPRISADATGSIAALGHDILSAQAVTPTLLLNYHFGDADSRLRPYVGVGVNQTHFIKLRSRLGGVARLSDTTGLALQVGVHYTISRHWGAFASIVRVDSKTRLTVDGVQTLRSTIDLRPHVYAAGMTYTF